MDVGVAVALHACTTRIRTSSASHDYRFLYLSQRRTRIRCRPAAPAGCPLAGCVVAIHLREDRDEVRLESMWPRDLCFDRLLAASFDGFFDRGRVDFLLLSGSCRLYMDGTPTLCSRELAYDRVGFKFRSVRWMNSARTRHLINRSNLCSRN